MKLRITEREFEVICEALMEVGHNYLALKIIGAHAHAYANKRFQRGAVTARKQGEGK